MDQKHCLFIGGIADGRRTVLTGGEDFFLIQKQLEIHDDKTQSIERHEYRLEKIHTVNKTFHLFIPKDWTIEQGIEKLVNGYCTAREE